MCILLLYLYTITTEKRHLEDLCGAAVYFLIWMVVIF